MAKNYSLNNHLSKSSSKKKGQKNRKLSTFSLLNATTSSTSNREINKKSELSIARKFNLKNRI